MGGGKPLVINGLPYGDTNRFGTGTPKSFPTTGYPGPAGAGLLSSSATQAFYGAERQRNTILRVVPGGAAAERGQNLLVLMMHEHGADPGISLAGMRDPLVAMGASNALAFDGLGGATLVRDSTVDASPGGERTRRFRWGGALSLKLGDGSEAKALWLCQAGVLLFWSCLLVMWLWL